MSSATGGPLARHRFARDPVSGAARRDIAVGRVVVSAVSDGVLVMQPRMVGAPGNPTAAFDELTAAYGEARLPVGCFVVRGERTVLVDAGIGPVDFADRGTLVGGGLLGQLGQLGLQPGDIDVVALTHLHGDHVGTIGALESGEPVFPNASVLVGRADWVYFIEDGNGPVAMADHVRRALAELDRRGRVVLLDDDAEVTAAVQRVASAGHTPGHSVYLVHDQDQRLYLSGDAMHCPQQLAHPDWAIDFDVSPAGAVRVREWLASEASRPGTIGVLGSHFPELRPVTV